MQVLASALHLLQVGPPVTSAGLTMFPLLRPDLPAAASYLLLDEALGAGRAEVTEVSDNGSVPELHFRNLGDRDILLVDGEELVGARQNRVLNLSILVAAGQALTIPVSCVEAGRWAWRSRRLESGRGLHAKARHLKMRGVSAAMMDCGQRARADIQADVWRSVDDKFEALGLAASATSSLNDAYAASEERLRRVRQEFTAQPGQVGAVFVIGGHVAGTDLFDAPQTLAKLLPKLVDSYAFDALELDESQPPAPPPSLPEVRHLLDRIADAPARSFQAVAKGTDLRIDEPDLQAAALVEGEHLLHLSAFKGDADASDGR
jgi:hypothetical protein